MRRVVVVRRMLGLSISELLGAGGALVAGCVVAWLWRARPWRGARTRYPVVLAHGFLGFDAIGAGKLKAGYFNRVAEHLESLGVVVVRPRVPMVASVEQRARALAAAIEAVEARRVNIVAHSMGGLDARYAISRLGLGRKVASLTTIGTPHHGTRVADVGTLGLAGLLGKIGLGALRDLTSGAAAAFNAEVKNRRGVRYGCVVASVASERGLNPLLLPSYKILAADGDSDGLVSVASQRWGRVLLRIEADHWAEIGWSKHFDAPSFYEQLVRKLRACGC